MDTTTIFSTALGIVEPWYVKNVKFDKETKRLDIQIDFYKGSVFNVAGVDGFHKAYDTVEKSWRHLNFFQHECHLTARVPRIKTPDGKIYTVEPAWSGLLNGFTLLFEAFILELARCMPVHQLSKIINISDYKIRKLKDEV